MGTLGGKVAIVTGGASGIGLATAKRLSAEGAHVVLVDLDEEGGTAVAAELDGRFVRADVGSSADWRQVVAEAEEAFGGIDLVYLNAGVTTQQADITAVTDEQVRRVFGANVDGVIFGVRAVVPAIERRGGGAIVATASLAGIIAFAPDPLYTATKHAVVGLVRSLAPQLLGRHVTINAVCPGIVDTPLVGPARERLKEAGFPMIPPEDIAAAVVRCMTGGAESGDCLVCQPGRPPVAYQFGEVPGPRTAGAEGRRPPVGMA
ncbi:MAG TPA: SDR family oxidoreductase [Acidimicrobiales bacterium]|nr:SDR family oxidoreductase [Acidimicrobiales bacterium]